MALVGYSDSESSDNESPALPPPAPKPATRAPKPGFQKVIDPSGPRRIKVDLPSAKPETIEAEEEERPSKKPRTAGLGGFNSFLPAPKRTLDKKPGLGSGVNLRTGAEPAFSRERPDFDSPAQNNSINASTDANPSQPTTTAPVEEEKAAEVKIVGNAMRFKPLSVANKKQKKKPLIPPKQPDSTALHSAQAATAPASAPTSLAPPPKKKISLFSVSQEEETLAQPEPPLSTEYQPILSDTVPVDEIQQPEQQEASYSHHEPLPSHPPPNSLDAIAADLNLSASARRQLFGRNATKNPALASTTPQIKHFDMEAEYASNEVLRQQGAAQEHRAVKAVAPGKHSLQQLVNAASTQKEALEDKWAEGKRNKAEGGSKYGW